MYKYIVIVIFLGQVAFLHAKEAGVLVDQLNTIYQTRVKVSKSKQMPIFAITSLGLKGGKSFNSQIFNDIQKVVGHFSQVAVKGISTMELYSQMEKYVAGNTVLSQTAKTPFKGCKAQLHKVDNKSCISFQALYVIPYFGEKNKTQLINRYFNAYMLSVDNSSFFTLDVYDKQEQSSGQCVYKQKEWAKDSYLLPNESNRDLYIDQEKLKVGESKTRWSCSNAYSVFGPNQQLCDLTTLRLDKLEAQGLSGHLLSAFSVQENSCQVKIQQSQIVEYSKKHKKISYANSESSYYSVIIEKNNHLLIYTTSAYCTVKPEIKEVYEDNFSNIQAYQCIGEEDSAYFSNYRLFGLDPEKRGIIEEEFEDF